MVSAYLEVARRPAARVPPSYLHEAILRWVQPKHGDAVMPSVRHKHVLATRVAVDTAAGVELARETLRNRLDHLQRSRRDELCACVCVRVCVFVRVSDILK